LFKVNHIYEKKLHIFDVHLCLPILEKIPPPLGSTYASYPPEKSH